MFYQATLYKIKSPRNSCYNLLFRDQINWSILCEFWQKSVLEAFGRKLPINSGWTDEKSLISYLSCGTRHISKLVIISIKSWWREMTSEYFTPFFFTKQDLDSNEIQVIEEGMCQRNMIQHYIWSNLLNTFFFQLSKKISNCYTQDCSV